MPFELRPYQVKAIDALYDYWEAKRGNNPLIVAPTGSGKTFIIAKIIKDAMNYPGTRVLLLTHVKELLEQDAKGLKELYPEANFGFYSASLNQKILNRPITFAGIQSVWERAFDMIPPPDLVLIDEAHLVPKNIATRYGKFLADLKLANPLVKVVGLTATHYRLDSGYLHKGKNALFDGIAYNIPISMLMDEGYLSPIISKGGLKQIDLTNVHKRGGEFMQDELAVAASDPELVRATVREIVQLGHNRKSWLIFASGIDHAYMLCEAFEQHCINPEVITGDMAMGERNAIIERFRNDRLRCLINVNVLTTGFDVARIDLVALVRATMSSGLYVQMVGRGTRTFPGKKDCLVLDYGRNVERHGFIDAVQPNIGGGTGEGDAPVKTCPQCQTIVHAAVRACPACGHQFPEPEFNHGTRAYEGALLSTQAAQEWHAIKSIEYRRWKKDGKPDSIRVGYKLSDILTIHEWLCPNHGGYVADKFRMRRKVLNAKASTTDEAMLECLQWVRPSRLKYRKNGKYTEVVQLEYRGGENVEAKVRNDEPWRTEGKRAELDDEIPF